MAILKKQSLVDQIYDEIKKQIIELIIPLGSKLNVSELQDKFGVSSTPVREAINRLQKDGIVEYENNIGAKVIDITDKDVYEIQEVSFALLTGAVRYAMQKGNNIEISKEIQIYIDKLINSNDKEQFARYILDISNVFYKHANNSRLIGSANLMYAQQAILRTIFAKESINEEEFKREYIKDFLDLYQAVKENNEIEAMKAFERNNFRARKVIIRGIKNLKK
ncbi:GntR family transcriptional regulator [Sarcina sp. JB2]|uniref:GntR family transcriptional regulator n=1 Tax=Candidatus Sarcina troglodytae TaxID=2726954 RepID=A0ACD1BD96_9CLOT|nr:GntR family transcriptional regulator [Sarcina sp. JB2]QPJ85381.1 GntR family transcriptional regulator [Sarcina sp. JB2]